VRFMRLMHFKRSGVVLLSALCLVLGTAATSLAAGLPARAHPARPASPPYGMSWRVYHLMLAQQPLDAAATRIQALAARPGPAHAGFFETKVDASRGILTVYWHGPVPATVLRLIHRLRATVDIRIVQTRYSLGTLNRDVLAAIHSGRGVAGGYPMTDGGGIVLGVNTANPHSIASLASALRSRFGVPVLATAAGLDHPQYCVFSSGDPLGPGSRCNDWPAFWGGDVIQQTSNGVLYGCTGGFGVHDRYGYQYLITAAHCAYNGSGYVNGITFHNGQDSGHWKLIGNITDVPGPHDWAIIPAASGNQYYDGPGISNGDTYRTKTVHGQQATSVGDWLCESGAFGGVLCSMQAAALNYSDGTWNSMVLATSGTGNFTIDGDSGGPWFSLYSGCSCVWAKGIHHGLYWNGSTLYEVFTPITVATYDNGITVNTG
jgi:hypothetical protein